MLKESISVRFVQWIDSIASRRWLSVLIVGLLAFAGSATTGLIGGIAEPKVHDEFSYLLAADTFAHGRLTNPTHPMWIHFESVHIIHQPTYMSKYPPGQGAILALGQWLSGQPIVGVWLSMGLMCAAICWMLHAWVPSRWALIGGLLALLNPILGINGLWAQNYWGGAVAATGGALVLGGIRYLLKAPQIHHALLTGIGLAILANSRPYEGLLLSVCAGSMLLWGFWRYRNFEMRMLSGEVIAPLLLVGGISVVWMGYYNYRLTGNVFRLPYQIHEASYGIAPLFVWQRPVPAPEYRHDRLRKFHTMFELPFYTAKHSWVGFGLVNFVEGLMYFVVAGNILALPLIVNSRALIRWIFRNPWARIAFVTYSVVALGIMFETYSFLHYWAPVVALNYYFTVQAMRLWQWRDRRIRRLVVPVTFCLVTLFLIVSVTPRFNVEADTLSPHVQRASLLAHLEQRPGKHVVLVSYGPEQSIHNEWVYNEADIDGAKVVWAHDMGRIENCKLVNYFKDRVIWSLNIERDDEPVKLNPFPRASCP